METIRNILVEDKHVHHIGFGIDNDIGGIQVKYFTKFISNNGSKWLNY